MKDYSGLVGCQPSEGRIYSVKTVSCKLIVYLFGVNPAAVIKSTNFLTLVPETSRWLTISANSQGPYLF